MYTTAYEYIDEFMDTPFYIYILKIRYILKNYTL